MLIVAAIKLNGENLYKTCFINYSQMLLQKGVVCKAYISGCLQHEADQNHLFCKLSNWLEGVVNDLSQFSLFACTFFKTSSETYLWRLLL